jgi:hypothetical protein
LIDATDKKEAEYSSEETRHWTVQLALELPPEAIVPEEVKRTLRAGAADDGELAAEVDGQFNDVIGGTERLFVTEQRV